MDVKDNQIKVFVQEIKNSSLINNNSLNNSSSGNNTASQNGVPATNNVSNTNGTSGSINDENIPRNQCSHSAVMIGLHELDYPGLSYEEKLSKVKFLMFGGYTGTVWLDDLYTFTIYDKKWTKVEVNGSLMCTKRAGQSAVCLYDQKSKEEKVLIYGGYNGTNRLNDCFVYNTLSNTWSYSPKTGALPTARSDHSAVARTNEQSMIIFGGQDNFSFCNDMYEYSLISNSWRKIEYKGNVQPKARSRHSALMRDNDRMIIFGGQSSSSKFNDVFEFNFKTRKWTELTPKNTPPKARYRHGAFMLSSDYMIVFGGCDSLNKYLNDMYILHIPKNKKNCKWISVNPEKEIPKSRAFFGFTGMPSKNGRTILFLYGGLGPKRTYYSDFFEFFISANKDFTLGNEVHKWLYEEQTCPNIVVKVGNSKYYCHKSILSQCKYFKQLILNLKYKNTKGTSSVDLTDDIDEDEDLMNISKKEIDTIELENTKPEVFEMIRQYLYGKTPEISVEGLVGLIQVSRNWSLDYLEQLCYADIEKVLTVKNSVYLLQEAYRENELAVRYKCLSFINKHIDDVLVLDEFKSLPPGVIVEIMKISRNMQKIPEEYTQTNSAPLCDTRKLVLRGFLPNSNVAAEKLQDHIQSLLLSQHGRELSDVMIESTDSKKFHVHKDILASQSEYFRALFCSGFEESDEYQTRTDKSIQIEGMDGETMEIIVKFIYGVPILNRFEDSRKNQKNNSKVTILDEDEDEQEEEEESNLEDSTNELLIKVLKIANMIGFSRLELKIRGILKVRMSKDEMMDLMLQLYTFKE